MKPVDAATPGLAAPAGTTNGPTRLMAKQLAIYYANCAMAATSPRDVSLFFGRYVPTTNEAGGQQFAELYERQIYMTVEQAADLARMLTETVQALKNRRDTAG
jgi:hypothetical protein